MKTTRLGKNGPEVSSVGLGCMGMSDFYGSKENDASGIETIHAALDHGINLLNTGDFYGSGRNEALIGRALKDRREKAFVSVKFGVLRTPSGGFGGLDLRPNAVKNFASYSLQRLGLDVIDLYQPSRIDPSVPVEDTVGAIADLIREGKVRYLGLSEANVEQIQKANAVHPVAALEIEYSIGTRFIESKILPAVREMGIGIVAYGVMSRGLLTGTNFQPAGPGDSRTHMPRFQGENLAKNQAKVAILEKMAGEKNCTTAQLCLAWVLSRGSDIVPLIGTRSKNRLLENLKGLDIQLTQADLVKLEKEFPEGAISGNRYPEAQMGIIPK